MIKFSIPYLSVPNFIALNLRNNKPALLIVLFLLLSPFFDLATGICIFRLGFSESFVGSPSQILRITFLFLSIPLLKKKEFAVVYFLFLYLFTIEIISFLFSQTLGALLSGTNYFMKIVYIYIMYILAKRIGSNNEEFVPVLINIFLYSACLYALGIIIPTMLGIGTSTYMTDGTFGQKGLYASGNALGIYLGTAVCIALLMKQKTKFDILCIALLVIAIILLGTKTAFLFLLISFVYYLQTKPRIIRMFILLFVASVIFVYHEILFSILSSIYDVVIYRFKENDNFFNFILSGRDNYVREAFSEFFKSNFWEVKLILGGGAFMSFRSEYVSGMIFDTLEMDFFDVLFMYGLIGALLYLSVIIYLIISSYRISRKLSFLFIFLFLHSFFAGHVFFDGLPVIAGVILYLMTKHINTVKSKFCI